VSDDALSAVFITALVFIGLGVGAIIGAIIESHIERRREREQRLPDPEWQARVVRRWRVPE